MCIYIILNIGWKILWENGILSAYCLSVSGTELNVKYNVVLEENLSYSVSSCGKAINVNKCTALSTLPTVITSGIYFWTFYHIIVYMKLLHAVSSFIEVLTTIGATSACRGNYEDSSLALQWCDEGPF